MKIKLVDQKVEEPPIVHFRLWKRWRNWRWPKTKICWSK